jgi:thiol-disulfide isomerase/thioredoxin
MNTFKQLLFICGLVLLTFNCTHPHQSGLANVTGKFTGTLPVRANNNPITIILTVFSPFLEHSIEYETQLKEDGTFSFDIPVVCSTFGSITSSIYNGGIVLLPNKTVSIEVLFNETGEKTTNTIKGVGLTEEDLMNISEISMKVFTALQNIVSKDQVLQPDMKPEAFSEYTIRKWDKLLAIIANSENLAEEANPLIYNMFKLFYLDADLLDYKGVMSRIYANQYDNEKIHEGDFVPTEPSKSYYSFFKYFELNNPQYLYHNYYFSVMQSILANTTLNIPLLGDTYPSDWLKKVKAIMTDLIGSDKGLFYDILIANAYIKQLNEEAKPLSDKQKANIKKYFSNKAFCDILFTENEKIIKTMEENSVLKINEIPNVSNEELMNALISNYKGQIVVVDMWATWCAPCLEAMKRSKPLKDDMKDKNVVFVYITGKSSKLGEWTKKIQEIGGEHYYLKNDEEWDYICENMGIEGIPTYLIFDKNGELKNKIIGFPGVEKMREMIEELL